MPHPVDSYVGKRVRFRRWQLGLTQQQLADKIGVKYQQIQKYETGANRLSASRLWEVATALDTPVSYFFEDASGNDSNYVGATEITDFSTGKKALKLVRAYYGIPVAHRKKLFDLARALSA